MPMQNMIEVPTIHRRLIPSPDPKQPTETLVLGMEFMNLLRFKIGASIGSPILSHCLVV